MAAFLAGFYSRPPSWGSSANRQRNSEGGGRDLGLNSDSTSHKKGGPGADD